MSISLKYFQNVEKLKKQYISQITLKFESQDLHGMFDFFINVVLNQAYLWAQISHI